MTELIVSRGDTFPRSFLDTYRSTKSRTEDLYNDLKSSRSDELVLQNPTDIPVVSEIHHGHSENLLDAPSCLSPTEGDFLDKPGMMTLPNRHRRRVPVYDRVDPEDSIRDIVTENDFYRFVLFKKHYDKYLHLSQKYEEARNIAYYLEEKYHEVKSERDGLLQQRQLLVKRLESNESLVREKEDEVFIQLERVVYLEEQIDRLKIEKERCLKQKLELEKERDAAYRSLKDQAKESESTRRKLEQARQEVIHHMTTIKYEKDYLERENDHLKEKLEAERQGIERYVHQLQKRNISDNVHYLEKEVNDLKLIAQQNATLSSQFQKAMQHLATCKRRKCSVCSYTKAAFGKLGPRTPKYDRKLFSCLQTPFLEMKNMLKPPPSPISGEGESLSEWFRPLSITSSSESSECSSLSVPFAELAISYMDDTSETSSNCHDNEAQIRDHDGLSHGVTSIRGFGSDSGFASDICAEYKSNVTTPKEKFSPKGTLDEVDCAKLTRTKWTASFRKLINRIRK